MTSQGVNVFAVKLALLFGLLSCLVFSGLQVAHAAAPAAERALLGSSLVTPLAASTNATVAQTIRSLRLQVASGGTTRIIVGVRVPFAPEGRLTEYLATQQRNDIATMHSVVLNGVPTLNQRPDKIKRFDVIPFMALEVTSVELEALLSMTEVTSIEEDHLMAHTLAESEPLIGGPSVWGIGYTGAGQTVAILDTGVDKTHPFLAGKVVSEACYSTTDVMSNASTVCPGGVTSSVAAGSALPYLSGVCPAGGCDHGTHVAGIVAGANASFAGVAKGASIIAIQVFSRFDGGASCGSTLPCVMSYQSDQILGLQRVYALRGSYNIAAVNMSLGGGQYFSQSSCDGANVSTKAVIDTLRAVNIATVISSGNDGYTTSMGAPGCISSAVSVGATWDSSYPYGYNCTAQLAPSNYVDYGGVDKLACFSNSASFLNLLAPGVWINSSIPGGGYANWSGTSMAAPLVAGAWAVLKQKAPAATVSEVLAALGSSGVAVRDARNSIVKSRISLPAALVAIGQGVSYAINVTKTGTGTGGITSSPAGIDCGTICSASFANGQTVQLTATPDDNSIFVGWSGACSGTGICDVTLNAAQQVAATFAVGVVVAPIDYVNLLGLIGSAQYFSVAVPAGARDLLIQTGGGTGDMDLYVRGSSLPTTTVYDCRSWGVDNNETCSIPTPLATTYYIMLSGYSAYSGVSLTVSYTEATPAAYTLTVSKSGGGTGTLISSPAGINCGTICSATFASGTVALLTATPSAGSIFSGWSGACSGSKICAFSINSSLNVSGAFRSAKPDLTPILMLILD